ncbi:MAG TPA: AMP-binding protein [Candidatus Acidoferrales bacterium]|jgi:long-chain acyl-CoA synthetase|nr:AMP-binding protein [Candidatus Acidoferrales bacterium]
MPRQSLVDFLNEFRRLGNACAIVQRTGYRTSRSSFIEIASLAAQCAREFELRGIQRGDRILLWGQNSAEWVAAFFGCILCGAVAVPMDQGATESFASRVAAQVDAKLIVMDRENGQMGGRRPTILFDSLKEVVGKLSGEPYLSPSLNVGSIAQIIFTSGTTAEPRGVVISHGNILANLEPLERGIQPYLKWERFVHPLRFLNLVPLSHAFGQFLGIWIPPLLGGCVYFQDSLNPSQIISTIRRERISALISVPRVLEALQGKIERDLEQEGALGKFRGDLKDAEKEKYLRRMWRFRDIHRRFGWKFWAVISGGATLDPETEKFWSRTGFAAIQGYGLTETTSLVSVNHPFRIGQGSIGKVLEGREVKLDGGGEILVRGKNIATGYWEGSGIHPVVTNAEDAGWFRTGDLGTLDSEGNLYFKGRKKNVIVTAAGMNVFPEDLEGLLRREPEVKDCAVVGVERSGNAEPCAVLLMRDEKRVKQPRHVAGIISRVNESLAEYQRMRSWFLWPEADFPRTSTGKPKLVEIRAAVEVQWGNSRSGENKTAANGGISELIARMHRGNNTAGANADLENELQLSSLDRVELMSALEDRYQVDLNEAGFASARTIGELETLVRGSSSAKPESVFPRWAQHWPVTWIRTFIYYLLTWPATHLMAHPQVFGRENLREVKGPVLIICNHVIYLDVGFVLAALPVSLRRRLAVAMGGERLAEMRQPPRTWFFAKRWLQQLNYFLVVTLFNVFPLPKNSGFRESFRFAGELADRHWNILIFPEGDLTPDGTVQTFRAGIGLLASDLKIPAVPMRIDGAFEIREERSLLNRPGRVRVTIGKPVEFPAGSDPQEITQMLQKCVAELGQGI